MRKIYCAKCKKCKEFKKSKISYNVKMPSERTKYKSRV